MDYKNYKNYKSLVANLQLLVRDTFSKKGMPEDISHDQANYQVAEFLVTGEPTHIPSEARKAILKDQRFFNDRIDIIASLVELAKFQPNLGEDHQGMVRSKLSIEELQEKARAKGRI